MQEADNLAARGQLSHALYRIARMHRALAGQLLREIGLHPPQELVMMRLWQDGPQRQTDLVRALDSDAATMTRTIHRLEHAGFVRRTPSPDDRRAVIIEATAASKAIRRDVERVWSALDNGLLGTATDEDGLMATLALMEENLKQATAPTGTGTGTEASTGIDTAAI